MASLLDRLLGKAPETPAIAPPVAPEWARALFASDLAPHLASDDLALPDWAMAILDSFDAAITLNAKRELMLEGAIVLTKRA